jgi:hypothetical protein
VFVRQKRCYQIEIRTMSGPRPNTNAAPKCQVADHRLHRRLFLQGLVGTGALSLMSWGGLFSLPAFAETAKKSGKHCILLWLCGAPSQFETWDPKPNSVYGGPFKSIPTKIPGIHSAN